MEQNNLNDEWTLQADKYGCALWEEIWARIEKDDKDIESKIALTFLTDVLGLLIISCVKPEDQLKMAGALQEYVWNLQEKKNKN